MKQVVEVRGVRIGEGIPKICVPVVGRTREEILAAAEALAEVPHDVVEWRADFFEDVFTFSRVEELLAGLRGAIGDVPLLFTFRTKKEGGEREITPEDYAELNRRVCGTHLADLVDAELFTGDALVEGMIREAHACGVKVIVSSHDFQKTPEKAELLRRLLRMQELGADLPKLAVMPRKTADVLTLLAATREMAEEHADRPIITMSMKGTGLISRLCGEVFGSAMTFGAAGQASAPGQMDAGALRTVLELLHEGMQE